jgi:pimeloyl-ACP methyl ester carboxylesterase
MTRSQPHFRNPSLLTFASEAPRAVTEMVAFSALTPLMTRLPAGDGRPVMVLPGFTASDQSTAALRYVLARLDYSVHGWHLGQNLGPSQRIVDGMINRFDEIHHRHGDQPVTLIGWSLGGLYSRALAARFPDKVRHVITLGSPFRLTRAEETNVGRWFDITAPVHGLRRQHSADFRREPYTGVPAVPSTAVFTKADGVVPWKSCVDVPGTALGERRGVRQPLRVGLQPGRARRDRRPACASDMASGTPSGPPPGRPAPTAPRSTSTPDPQFWAPARSPEQDQ